MVINKLTLKQARVLANLTQDQASEKLGISRGTLIAWEKGYRTPNSKMIPLITETYGIPYDMIMFLEKEDD
ncbi:MAG: helix-turn-helix transcriptional regulator [Paludibacteraceae bacterium]|nr:helix-turn-helix transcriptional regulator [Paludibacteraceae bacterium]